jgi:hypothetical protein
MKTIKIIKEYRYGIIQWEKALNEDLLTNRNAVEKNQPAQEKSSDQETKGQTKMILSEEDPVNVVQ